MGKPLSVLSFYIRKSLEKYNLIEKNIYLSVSGGRDSMILLNAFLELHSEWRPFKLKVFHVHHGTDSNVEYRNKAKKLVVSTCADANIEVVTNEEAKNNLASEADFREFRQEEWAKIAIDGDVLVTGHHQQDLLETRLHRLLRGTGISGLSAMEEFNGKNFRPMLASSQSELEDYVQKHNISFVQDPTNTDTKYFRNWIRNELLPSIEAYKVGSVQGLGQSLENIVFLWDNRAAFFKTWIVDDRIKRLAFSALDQMHQMQVLVEYLKLKNVNQYRRSQLEEITKLLDRRDSEFTFKMIGCVWKVSPEWVEASLLD